MHTDRTLTIRHVIELGTNLSAWLTQFTGLALAQRFQTLEDLIMKTKEELQAELTDLQQTVADEKVQADARQDAALAKFAELEAQIAAGADLSSLSDTVAEIKGAVQNIVPTP